MKILDDLISNLSGDAPIRDILIGKHWTVVCSRSCGMASTLAEPGTDAQYAERNDGNLLRRSARELAEFVYSDDPLEAGLGLAAINSLLEVDESKTFVMNASDAIANLGQNKNVALVGHFPFIPSLRQEVRELFVLELNPRGDDYPADRASEIIPEADVVAITGSTFINHTLEDLLAFCRPGIPVMVLGPSTPLSPVLHTHGIKIISGTRIIDEPAVLRTVGQGASFRQVEGVKLLTLVENMEMIEQWNA